MPKNSVSDWDTTAGNNTDIAGVNIDENCPPSSLNNGLRAIMAQIKSFVAAFKFGAGSVSAPSITTEGDTNTGIHFPGADQMALGTGGVKALQIGTGQQVSIGTAVAAPSNKNSVTPALIVSKSSVGGSAQIIRHTTPGVGGAILMLGSTRGTAADDYTISQANDGLGSISYFGADSAGYVVAADIVARVAGTPGANDMPGRLLFGTTADGASSTTTRMSLEADGRICGQTTATVLFSASGYLPVGRLGSAGGSPSSSTFLRGDDTWANPSPTYTSSDITITAGAAGNQTLAHGLGAIPKHVSLFLVCTSAELGYSVGEVVPVEFGTINGNNTGVTATVDATNIKLYPATSVGYVFANRASSNTLTPIDTSKWAWRVQARA